jgi:hypothetical protein
MTVSKQSQDGTHGVGVIFNVCFFRFLNHTDFNIHDCFN